MSISDILTILTIILALLAFYSEKSRDYLRLKFNLFDFIVLLVIFLFIHFLLSFYWLSEKFDCLKILIIDGLPEANIWAYIITILTLSYITYKILFGFYPSSNREKVIKKYNELILKNEYLDLAELIEKLHMKDILKFIEKSKLIRPSNDLFGIDFINKKKELYNKFIKSNRLKLGDSIYSNIILNKMFIRNVALVYPYYFVNIISSLDGVIVSQPEFMNEYLKTLMKEKNIQFFNELRYNINLGMYDDYIIDPKNKILFSLFNNIQVAQVNEVYKPIGEQAIYELDDEIIKGDSILRKIENQQDNETLWNFRIKNAIHFFDIMVRQSIVEGLRWHMWLWYYEYFVDRLIRNMFDITTNPANSNRHTRNYELIEDIFENMLSWLEVVKKSNNTYILDDIAGCITKCFLKFGDTAKLTIEEKSELLEWYIDDIFFETFADNNEQIVVINQIIDWGIKIFSVNIPNYGFRANINYIEALKHAWGNRDRAKINEIRAEREQRFQNEVIDKFANA